MGETNVCPQITLFSGDSHTLGPCRNVLEMKVRACRYFPNAHPPEIIVFDATHSAALEDHHPAPMQASVVFCETDHSPALFDASFVAFAKFDLENAGVYLEKLVAAEPVYLTRRFLVAARTGDTDTVQALLNVRADVNALDDLSWTALMHASENGRAETVQTLIKAAANINLRDLHSQTALIFAASEGYAEIVETLTKNSADVCISNEVGRTALLFAAQGGYLDIVHTLVSCNGYIDCVDTRGYNALSRAAQHAGVDMLRILIHYKADLEITNRDGDTVVARAVFGGKEDNATYLLSVGAPLGSTALYRAVLSQKTELVEFVLARDKSLKTECFNGKTPREWAAIWELADIVGILNDMG